MPKSFPQATAIHDAWRFAATVARQALPVLLRILVTGPAHIALACLLAFALVSGASGTDLIRSIAAEAAKWGTAFREMPVGSVPNWRCPMALADPGSSLPALVAQEECRVVPMAQEEWVDAITAQALHVYELLVLATLLLYPMRAVLRLRGPGSTGTPPQRRASADQAPRDEDGTTPLP